MPRFMRYLKTQIILAILLLTALFAGTSLYSMHVIDRQLSDQSLLHLAGQLQFNQQHLTMQAMQYSENAPRNYASYNRDLRLYFQDLKHTRQQLADIIKAFASNDFHTVLADQNDNMMPPMLPGATVSHAYQLAETWRSFSARLDERIGSNPEEPRLEWAAEWIAEQNSRLERASAQLVVSLENEIARRAARAQALNRSMLVIAILLAVGIMLWFYLRVLKPMTIAVRGFDKVANGDFAHQVPVMRDDELGWMAGAFNRLSQRLTTMRKLLIGLEQGGNLDSTLQTLSDTLPTLIPVDWIGVLVVGIDGRIHLEKAVGDGKIDPIGQQTFSVEKTLLEECIETRQPLHVADVGEMARISPAYVFLKRLEERGRRDAVFLPIGNGKSNNVQGVVVFASRFPNSYRTEHLELLQNIGILVGISLGRTIQLVESTRLASIGQFASGIVHEIRNPLATISLALEHMRDRASLPESSAKRVALAGEEVARLERLLADILLYAKPLTLQRETLDITVLLRETLEASADDNTPVTLDIEPCPPVLIDADRMRQVLLNLIRNAQQASPDGQSVLVSCRPQDAEWLELAIDNGGAPIPAEILDRVFEPFVTSKSRGTGLGLSIVQRIVQAHGGEIEISSDAAAGTRLVLRLPLAGNRERQA